MAKKKRPVAAKSAAPAAKAATKKVRPRVVRRRVVATRTGYYKLRRRHAGGKPFIMEIPIGPDGELQYPSWVVDEDKQPVEQDLEIEDDDSSDDDEAEDDDFGGQAGRQKEKDDSDDDEDDAFDVL